MTQSFMNMNLQSILNQARTTCSNIFSSSNGGSGSNQQYVNSIFSLINEGEAAINGGDEQKAQAITSMVQNILSMFSGISNEKAKATQDGEKNDTNADNVTNNANQTAEETISEANKITENIDSEESSIQGALDQLEELCGDDGEDGKLAQKKQELQDILDEIEAQKDIINDGVSSIETKRQALDKVRVLSGNILELTAEINDIQAKIEELSATVETSSDKIGNLVEESASVVDNGAQKLQGHMQNAGQQVGVNTSESVKGTTEETTGADLIASGETLSATIYGQSAGAKAIQIGNDLLAGGGIRIKNSAATNSKLTAALGLMANKANEFQGALNNVIGSALKANNLIGQYGVALDSAITSIGSWSTVADGQAELENSIKEADVKLNETESENPATIVDLLNSRQKQEENISSHNIPWQQTNTQPSNNTSTTSDSEEKQIFKFERKSFGI